LIGIMFAVHPPRFVGKCMSTFLSTHSTVLIVNVLSIQNFVSMSKTQCHLDETKIEAYKSKYRDKLKMAAKQTF
jgi:hypothetical protein